MLSCPIASGETTQAAHNRAAAAVECLEALINERVVFSANEHMRFSLVCKRLIAVMGPPPPARPSPTPKLHRLTSADIGHDDGARQVRRVALITRCIHPAVHATR